MKLIIWLAILISCSKTEPKTPELEKPSQDILALYESVSGRLIDLLDGGYVVSRWDDGRPEHLGDALIWSGIALAVLTCEKGDQIESVLFDMIDTLGGGLWRHPSLPDQISLDGAIGLYRGAAKRIMSCPNSRVKWIQALSRHLTLNKLNPNSDLTWPLEFKYVPELALAVASNTSNPDPSHGVALSGQINGWALAVQATHSACYRLNLGYQTLRTIETLGFGVNKAAFCEDTKDTGLATIDHWCGRSDGHDFINNFHYDEWEYHPQRCDRDSQPDGQPGLHTPGLDLLEMISEVYVIQ